MNFEVTLKQLVEHNACKSSYDKLVKSLKNKDVQISLLTILENNGLDDALWCLRIKPEWARDRRLFSVWCVRQVQYLLKDKRSLNAINVGEKFANGQVSQEELRIARNDADAAAVDEANDNAINDAVKVSAGAERDKKDIAIRTARGSATWAAGLLAFDDDRAASAYDITRSAAWAVRAAAWAAWDEDEATAWEDASALALDAQKQMFIKMCNGQAPWQIEEKQNETAS